MNKIFKYLPPLLIMSLIVYFTIEAYATSTGRVLRTSTVDGGCGGSGCHGTASSSNTSVTLNSGPTTVELGSTNSYSIRVANSGKIKAGINIAVKTSITGNENTGELAAPVGSGLQVLVNELTHTSPKDFNNNNTDFNFTWTAPDKPGTYFLRAVGNAVNADGGTSGDEWNFMTPAEIIVKGVEISEPKGGGNYCAGTNLIIRWVSAGIEDIKIELSNDGGNSWNYVINNSFKAVGGNFTWAIPTDFQQGNRFRIRLSDVTNPSLKSEMTSNFGIFGQFTVTKHPESKEMCPGDNHILYVNTTGTGLTYQWRKNGSAIPGATDSVLVLNNVNMGTTGYYGVVVSSSCFSPIISNESHIQIRTPTVINSQPKDDNVCLGGKAEFEVDADGHGLQFQWFKGAIAINGATSSILTINNVQQSDVAAYYCEVTGFCGMIKSSTVNIKLNEAAKITKQPSNQTVCEKTNVTISLEASGLDNTYEWYFNDTKLNVPSNPALTLNNVLPANAGTYHCIVKNDCGNPVKSNEVQLIVNPLPRITLQPQARVVMVGDFVEFVITAQNANTYQWRKNNVIIQGANEPNLVIESSQIEDAGDYDCVITNNCGNVTTTKAKLTVNEPEPGPRISFSSQLIDFGDVFEERSVDSLFVGFITNIGNDTLLIDSIRIISNDEVPFFELTFEDSTEVEVGESADISIIFTPQTPGPKSAKLKIYSNAVGEVPEIDISGDGAYWDVVSNRSKVELTGTLVGTSNTAAFRIFNQSDYPVIWIESDWICSDGAESPFKVSSTELPDTIGQKSSRDVEITFEPLEAKDFDCSINFVFAGTDKTLKVNVSGEGFGMSVNSELLIPHFNVFPNPSNENLTFEFTVLESNNYTLEIIDNQGKTVLSETENVFNEKQIYTWNGLDNYGTKLPSGSYTVVIRTEKAFRTMNIILVR